MDQRSAEGILILILWLVTGVPVVFGENVTYSMNNATAISGNNYSTTKQPGNNNNTPTASSNNASNNITPIASSNNASNNITPIASSNNASNNAMTPATNSAMLAGNSTLPANPGGAGGAYPSASNDTLGTPVNSSTDMNNTNTGTNNSNETNTQPVANTADNASVAQMPDNTNGIDNYNQSNGEAPPGSGNTTGGGDGGGGNSSSSMSSNSPAGNRTSNMTTVAPLKPILCYNCSGNNCRNTTDNDTTTCTSNTGTCYIRYDAVATALSLSCTPLLTSSNACPSNNSATKAKSTCEVCCMTSFCNSRSPSEVQQLCSQTPNSSAIRIGNVCKILTALIVVIHSIFW